MTKTRSNPTATEATTYHPVDGGWAWVILLANTVTFMLFIGTLKSFGIYFVALIEHFEAKATTVSIIYGVSGCLQYFLFFSVALLVVTIGLKYLSCRQSMVISGALGFIAYLAGSLANRIEIVIFTHGVLYGLGFSFMHGPAMYLIGLYFKQRRDLANAITVAAGGLGGLVLPPIYRYLIDTYGLKGALLITSGILMNTLPMAFLLRPPSFYKGRRSTENGITCILNEKMENLHSSSIVKTKTGEVRARSISVTVHSSAPQNETMFGSLPHIPNRSMTSIENNALFQSFSSIGSMDAMNSFSQLDLRRNIEKNSKRDVAKNVGNDQNVEKVLDLSLLKEPLIVIFMISYCLGSIGSVYGIQFAPAFAKGKNIGNHKIAFLVSIMNGCDFVGRLLSGVIVDRKILKSHQMVSLSQFITGLTMAFCSLYTQFWHFVLFSIVYGLCGGSIFALTPSIIVDVLGLEHFRSAFGLLGLAQGMILSGSSPLIGFLRDKTATYTTSFYFMASLLFVAAFTLLLEPYARKRQSKMLSSARYDEEGEISLQVDA